MIPDDIPAHSEHGPSSAEGWFNCADYINANRGLPDDQSWEAAEGTFAHIISDECLSDGTDADSYIGRTETVGRWDFTWTEDDAMLLQHGIDWLRSNPGSFYSEQRVEITQWVGLDSHGRRQFGTLDRAVITDEFCIISDLKWGRGVPVRPERNKQLMLYALAFYEAYKPEIRDFVIHIDQPRHMGGGGRWECTLDDLLAFGEEVRRAADATRQPNPPRTATEKGCMWCRRKNAPGGCGTLDEYVLRLLQMEFDDLDAPALTLPTGLTPERRRTLFDHRKMIETWLERNDAELFERGLAGDPTGGLKIIEGRKDADRWEDEKGAAQIAVTGVLRENCFTQKLISPTQVSKRVHPDSFDWLLIEPHIKRGKRKLTLVPEEDDRPAVTSAAEFEDLDD
ncbi:DUF2800 domain-containing protein [Novosphingobium resinovorum]|uniref:PD-(D/E)XK endonuclease-like domain-containing protein n=1 Tax=Novosphingobium resinovorum TaxID=158500 RepID=A0A1D8A321_9SPHN|nr:DUF2800 domain-containing protein [Novosphingobium resinovorum]AOR76517.1 hypothetical protein BES08_07000 [Novosphingobium resinovorum]